MKIEFNSYNGIEDYIELMKHDVEPLNDPECIRLDLCYNGKDIKAVLDYITKLQEENKSLEDKIDKSIDFVDSNIEDEYEWNGLLYHNEVKDELLNILKGSEDNVRI